MLNWTSLFLGVLLGVWGTYIVMAWFHGVEERGWRVLGWGAIAMGSSLLTKFLIGMH